MEYAMNDIQTLLQKRISFPQGANTSLDNESPKSYKKQEMK